MKPNYPNVASCDPRKCITSKIMKTHRILNAMFRKYLKDFGLTNSQLSVLFILSKKGKTTQGVLAEMLYLEKSSVSRNMKRLYDKEYVSKAEFPIIGITDKGLTLLDKIIPEWDKAMAEAQKKLGNDGVEALDLILTNLTH